MRKNWGGNRRKRFYSEMQGNFVEGGACGNPVGLSMYDGPTETAEYIWVNIW